MKEFVFIELTSRETRKGKPPSRVMVNVEHISDLHEEEVEIGIDGMDSDGSPCQARVEKLAGISTTCGNIPLTHTYDEVKQLLQNEKLLGDKRT